jgi:NADH:ubiquinone oxidoreductase subunit 2 (subunit N)
MIDKLSWIAVYPEIVLLGMACVIAMADLFVTNPRRTATYVLTMRRWRWSRCSMAFTPAVVRRFTRLATWWSAMPWGTGSSALPPLQ